MTEIIYIKAWDTITNVCYLVTFLWTVFSLFVVRYLIATAEDMPESGVPKNDMPNGDKRL